MITVGKNNLNLKQIAESGQCFRWQKLDKAGNKYSIVANGLYLEVEQIGEYTFNFYCSEQEFTNYWHDYFDMGTNYAGFISTAENDKGLIRAASKAGNGIRILRQQTWEMLITFLTAQNLNIDRVTLLIERLCNEYGSLRTAENGAEYRVFPTAEQLAQVKPEELRLLGFGYRDKQIINAAKIAACKAVDIERLRAVDHDTAKLVLTNIFGVGEKVAECICLFGLHKLESYPVDTWVKKIEAYLGSGYVQNRYPAYGGVMQQYLFAYVRRYGLPESEVENGNI